MSPSANHQKLGKRLFLIDGSSFCYRAFYAIRNLSTSKGQPTNAVYGVVAMLRKLLADETPDYLAVAFDLPKPTFRHLKFEGYKEHRKPTPDALVDQFPWIKEVLKGFRIPMFEMEGYEADDLLGTLALAGVKQGFEVSLVTNDKDALQLLGNGVRVYRPGKEGPEILDDKSLLEKWGLRPDQVIEVMALMGDDVDAIPGVPGIGEKTAVGLIQKFGSVEKLLSTLEKTEASFKPSVAKAIRENKEQVRMSRELAALDTAVPLKLDWEAMKTQEPDRAALSHLFQTLEFRSLAKEFEPDRSADLPEVELLSAKRLKELLPEIRKAGSAAIALHDESVGLAWGKAKAAALPAGEGLEELRLLCEDPAVRKICPELKEVLLFLLRAGIELKGETADPCLASYLLDPTRVSHRVEALALEFLGRGTEGADAAQTAGAKALAAWELAPLIEGEAAEKGVGVLLRDMELPLARVLARMEHHGIAVDLEAFSDLSKEIAAALEGRVRQITDLAGTEFNLNSPKQLGEILFGRLKLPVIKRTKTGPSTDEEVLRRLSGQHELPAKILEYRELSKLDSTYVRAIPELVDPETGRVHASFNQTVTATGRLSSSDPNLQNIPIRSELGRRIRKGFISSHKNGWILTADYSQIELRILAHLAEDEVLAESFRSGKDIHRATASLIFGVSPEQVEPGQRGAAKTINFGIIYGMSSFGLSKELGIDPSEAQQFIEQYFAQFPRVKQYLEESLKESCSRGYCLTLFNRRRNLPELQAREASVRQFAERVAVNAPIQGSAADIIKAAMVAIDRLLDEQGLKTRMICQVHDELIFDVPDGELKKVEKLVKETMEEPVLSGKPVRLSVPIEVNVKAGRNWYEASHA